MQKMMTKQIEREAPRLYATEGLGNMATAVAHYFTGPFDWFLTEYDPETGEAFGLISNCKTGELGLGYFNIREFEEFNRTHSAFYHVERDMHWTPCLLRSIRIAG